MPRENTMNNGEAGTSTLQAASETTRARDVELTLRINGEARSIGLVGIAAAIANAVYHAKGLRVRDLPITLDRLL
jgi:hypothetical protein